MEKRNKALDVLRSIAIILVVNCHIGREFASPELRSILGLGSKGVDLFFALSGWLLGQQLLREMLKTGTIDVKNFLFRRWFRTLPAYYTILLFTYLWQIVRNHNYNLDPRFLWFGQNYFAEMPYFGVSWSLCVEEYFYLFIAPVLLLLRRRWGPPLVIMLLLIPLIARSNGWYERNTETHVRWDQCGIGVLLAYFNVYLPSLWDRLCRVAGWLAALAFSAILLNIAWRCVPSWEIKDWGIGTWSLISICFVLLANSSVYWKSEINIPLSRYVADRAYSLYLTHVEALVIVRKIVPDNFILATLLTWCFSFLFAEILYRCVERPWLKSRDRFLGSVPEKSNGS